jgi:lysosomal Pro-X carboxypeptidase
MKQYSQFILFICLPLILFIYLIPAHSFIIPRFSPLWRKTLVKTNTNTDVKTYYYKLNLDHFNYFPQSYKTFRQRYFINFKYWGCANFTAPIFVIFGGEEELDAEDFGGFIEENAASFKALLIYIEVRYEEQLLLF